MRALIRNAAIAVSVLVCVTTGALAQIAPGSELVGTMDRELSSKSSQVGQPFKLTNVQSHNSDINGGTIFGHVGHIQHPGQGKPAKIELEVDKINTRSGNIYQLTGYVSNVKVHTKSNAGKEGAAAAAGALVGGLIAGGWGAVIGGSGGFLVAKNNRENITVPQGSLVTVHVTSARRQKSY